MNPMTIIRPAARRALRTPRGGRPLSAFAPRCMATPSDAYGSVKMPRMRPDEEPTGELAVGELHGAKFRVEPLRRVGETDATKRARLLCTFSLSLCAYDAPERDMRKWLTRATIKTNLANAASSSPTSSSPPLPPPTCPP